MIERSRFDLIRERHGAYASWAVWTPAADKPKSNVSDLTLLDPDLNPSLLKIVHAHAVMVGLNISRPLLEPFRNFHDPRPQAQDYKIRFAFENTPWWGAYMTDIIKNVETIRASDLLRVLTPELLARNVKAFVDELRDLTSSKPTLLTFGNDAHRIVATHVPGNAYQRIVRLTHYSHQVSKDNYRQAVLKQIADAEAVSPSLPGRDFQRGAR